MMMRADDSSTPTGPTIGRYWPASLLANPWIFGSLVVVSVLIATILSLELWRIDWEIPLAYQGDAVLIAAHIKTDVEYGWYETQSMLGAPFGQVYHDWKSADNLHHIAAAFLGIFIKNFGVVMNLYYVLGFVFAGLAAAWFLRLIGVSRAFSLILGVLYAIAPYHFIRGESHMWLSGYYPIPLALGVVYWIARGRPIWGRNLRFSNPVASALTGRSAFTVFALALVATANSYYAFWTVLFIAFVGLARLIHDTSWKAFFSAVAAGVFTVVVMVINMLPDIIYSAMHGSNSAAVVRYPVEAEVYSLKFMQLILPQTAHRLDFLSQIRHVYDTVYPYTSENAVLGLIAALGFVAALAVSLYSAFAFGVRRTGSSQSETMRVLGVLSALTLFAFLLSTFGGLSSLISLFTSDLRGWNRMSIVISMLALGVAGILIDLAVRAATRNVTSRLVARSIGIVTAVVVLLVGYLDQVPPVRVPDYAGVHVAFAEDAKMVKAIEEAVPEGSMIAQLPYRKFPETVGNNGVPDTDQLLPYLHSDNLRWSGGGIKGRPTSEWLGLAEAQLTTGALVDAVTAAGFAGVLIDLRSYADDEGDEVAAMVKDSLGEPAYTSLDGRYQFFTTERFGDVTASSVTDDIGDWVVTPVMPTFEPDLSRGYSIIGSLKKYDPRLTLTNPRQESVEVEVSFHLSYRQGRATIRVDLPDGTSRDFAVSSTDRIVSFRVAVPPGTTLLPFTVVEGEAPQASRVNDPGPIQVRFLRALDTQLAEALQEVSGEDAIVGIEVEGSDETAG